MSIDRPMPRKTTTAPKTPVITTKIDRDLYRLLRAAVRKQDTDLSKFTRQALREKLSRLGVSL